MSSMNRLLQDNFCGNSWKYVTIKYPQRYDTIVPILALLEIKGLTGATRVFVATNAHCLSPPGYSNRKYAIAHNALTLASPNMCN